jgi:CubicO group peptidase (beta-lactamase class C family)
VAIDAARRAGDTRRVANEGFRMRLLPIVVALAVALAGAPVQAQQSPPPIRIDDTMVPLAAPLPDAARMARFDAFVAAVQKQFDVPGVAVAVVKDGKSCWNAAGACASSAKPAKVDATPCSPSPPTPRPSPRPR